MTFEQLMKAHLSNYKVKKLALTRPEKWRGGRMDYHYILPANKRDLNLLGNYRMAVRQYIDGEDIKLQGDFHHLNSSQALSFNFFYPLIAEEQLPLLLKVVELEDEEVGAYGFEKTMGEGEKKNFDFYLKLKSGKEVVFEIKYTEEDFSKKADNERDQKQDRNVCQTVLAGKIQPNVKGYQALQKNYQLLQDIAYIQQEDGRLLVVVCPGNNKTLHFHYNQVMDNIVVPELQRTIQMLPWENLLEGLKIQLNSNMTIPGKLIHHYREFEDKYFPI